jgi:uncharacterized protein
VPSPPVVSNTTPLIALAGVGLLDLLQHLYGDVTIPSVVRDEYWAKATPVEPDLTTLPWLQIVQVVIDPALLQLPSLGQGEAAAITLALQLQATTILLDERRACRTAQQHGLQVTGSLGVLLAAKQIGYLAAVRPVLDTMIAQKRHISPALYDQVLRAAGEAPGS